MTERPLYDIFLSYRREGGFEVANLIHDRLSRQGYRVFMDIESMRSGKFNDQLYRVIDQAKDVVVILSPQSLDRCVNEGDWLRLEIARALAMGKNVVPVMLRNFTFPENLPSDIDALRLHNGVEASQELFNAFIERLKGLVHAKKQWTLSRFWRPITFALIPVACALAVIGYLHLRQKTRLAQVCREVVSVMGLEFVKMNNYLAVMEQAEKGWVAFADAMDAAPPGERPRLADAFLQQLAQHRRTLQEPNSMWPLTPEAERLLEEKGQPTQDMKVFFRSDHRMEASKFLDHLEMWAKTPHQRWLTGTREVVKLQGESYREMMVGTYYAFLELQAHMPPSGREAFLQAKPMLTRFPEADPNWGVAELKARQDGSFQRAQDLEHQCAMIVGKDSWVIQELQNQVKALATKIAPGKISKAIGKQLDAEQAAARPLPPQLQAKAAAVQAKRQELQAMQSTLEDAYRRLLEKTAFRESDESSLMWGKILRLARMGKDALERGPSGIPPERIFSDVRERLATYAKLQSAKDPGAPRYTTTAGHYYAAVAAKRVPMQGILMMGTQDGQSHPVLRVGDIVLERKGQPIKCFEDYSAMKDNPAPSTVKLLRFDSKGSPHILTLPVPASTILVGFLELWEN